MKQLTILFPPQWSVTRNIWGITMTITQNDIIAGLIRLKIPVKKIANLEYRITLTRKQHISEILDKSFLKELKKSGLQVTVL